MGATIELLHHLWETDTAERAPPQPEPAPLAQTSGGVVNALEALWRSCFAHEDAVRLMALFERRRIDLLGVDVLTFKGEFLHTSRLTKGGLLVVTVGVGNVVRSVDTWEPGQLAPRALNREEARKLWARGAWALVVDRHADQIVAYRATGETGAKLALAEPPPPPPPPGEAAEDAEDAEGASAEVRATRALIKAARAALRPENWALRPVASA